MTLVDVVSCLEIIPNNLLISFGNLTFFSQFKEHQSQIVRCEKGGGVGCQANPRGMTIVLGPRLELLSCEKVLVFYH